MTTINNFDDILSAMEQNPQLREAMRNHILGEEFLQLPSIVRQSQDLIVRVMEKQIELSGTVRQVSGGNHRRSDQPYRNEQPDYRDHRRSPGPHGS